MRRLLAFALLAAVGCSASPKSVKSADHKAIEDLDNAFTDHITRTALPRSVATEAGFKEQLDQKVESLKVLERAYLDFRDSSEPAVAAHASRRLGQLYLNTACEVTTLQITAVEMPKFKPVVEQALADTARPIMQRAQQFFDEAATHKNGGEHAAQAQVVADAMKEPEPRQVCVSTAAHWEAPNRPETAPQTAVLGVLKGGCGEAISFLLDKPNPDCFDEFSKKCDEGNSLGCEQVGRHHFHAGALEAAHDAFTKSCELGGNCRSRVAMSAPGQKESYVAACDDGSALGCMQLARLLESEEPTIRACTAAKVPSGKNAAKRCQAGEAAGCWARAGELAVKTAVEIPPNNAGLLGGLGMSGPGNETPEQRRQRLTQECRNEQSWSCISLAGLMKEAGEDPTPIFRDACRHGRAGCHALAEHLLDAGKPESTTEAVDLLTKNCADDWLNSCSTAARLFAAGEGGVAKSSMCAAALSWRMCTPTNTWDCSTINSVFGHNEKK